MLFLKVEKLSSVYVLDYNKTVKKKEVAEHALSWKYAHGPLKNTRSRKIC